MNTVVHSQITANEIRLHIEKKFAQTEISHFPFPHLIIENFFPEEVFAKVLEYNPFKKNKGAEWISKKNSAQLKTDTPYYARKQINLIQNKFAASEQEQIFWNELRKSLLDEHWFEKLIFSKYQEYFIIRFGELVNSENFFELFKRQMFLQRHEPGYYIGPHTDVPTRVFTCIFAFADRDGFEEFGTELIAPKNEMARCWGSNHYPSDDFETRVLAPYKPNNFLLFFKTRQSFHAVRAIDETVPNQRYGMQFQYYEPPSGLFTDLSRPDLMQHKHEKNSTKKAIKEIIKGALKK